MPARTKSLFPAVAALLLLTGTSAPALINPNFTPLDLMRDAERVLVLKLGAPNKKGQVQAPTMRAISGKAPAKPLVIDVAADPDNEHAKLVLKMMAGRVGGQAVLVAGKNERGEPAAWLHYGGRWVDLYTEDDKVYEVEQINAQMEGTWASSTDMLIRVLDYAKTAPNPISPVNAGCAWGQRAKIGNVPGAVHDAQPVDLNGDGRFCLYLAAETGDRLFRWNKKKAALEDVTAARKLKTRSRTAAWADFNADGRLDLASWNGKSLVLVLQGKDGSFAAGQPAAAGLDGPCLGINPLDVGAKGRPGLLLSTKARPILLVPGKDGALSATPLDPGKAPLAPLGASGRCLVADFDGDHIADVLQPFKAGSLLYAGTAPGRFRPAVRCAVALGVGAAGAFVGDYDGNGLLDVFAGAEDSCRLWHNTGKLRFTDMLPRSGELAYISKGGGTGGVTCDINNDGRQDVLIVYSGRSPHLFFNRGFRSFGHAHKLDLEERGLLTAATLGLQTAAVADFNGDGAQDLVVVLKGGQLKYTTPEGEEKTETIKGGQVWLFPREVVAMGSPMCVRVALPLGGPYAGPLTVTAWADKTCLGAWNVMPGTGEAFFGKREPGEITLRWQLPGGKPQEKTFTVEDEPVRLVVGKR